MKDRSKNKKNLDRSYGHTKLKEALPPESGKSENENQYNLQDRDALYFLTVGSKNQDDRGAMLDGENSYVVAGPWSLVYYPDFMGLMANTTWIEKQEQLDALISVEETKARKLGRKIRKVL